MSMRYVVSRMNQEGLARTCADFFRSVAVTALAGCCPQPAGNSGIQHEEVTMSYDFNADEVFDLAIRIEENGARFYRRAAELQADAENRTALEKLAALEETHKTTFEKMKQSLSAAEKTATVFDPQGESAQYFMAMADMHGGEGSPSAAEALTAETSILEIIDTAIGLEKESILFYLGLKDLVPPNLGQDKVFEIIDEERRHIVQLNAYRKRLQT